MGHESGESTTELYEWNRKSLTGCQANPKYLSVNWEASGGGAFAVIPINEKGRLPDQLPLFRGHTAVVLDTDWYDTPRVEQTFVLIVTLTLIQESFQ